MTGPAHRGEGLNYFESLQVSLLALAIHGGLVWLSYWLRIPDRFGALYYLIGYLFLVLVVSPAVVAAALHIPFPGFRISIAPNPPGPASL